MPSIDYGFYTGRASDAEARSRNWSGGSQRGSGSDPTLAIEEIKILLREMIREGTHTQPVDREMQDVGRGLHHQQEAEGSEAQDYGTV